MVKISTSTNTDEEWKENVKILTILVGNIEREIDDLI